MSAPYLSRHHAMTLLFLHIPKNIQLEKCTITHLTLIYLSFTEGWSQRFRVQEKKISRSRHAEVWLQSTDKNARNFIFCRACIVPLMYWQNEFGLINPISVITVQNSCYIITGLLTGTKLGGLVFDYSRHFELPDVFFSVSATLVWSNKANTLPAPSCLFIHINAMNQF